MSKLFYYFIGLLILWPFIVFGNETSVVNNYYLHVRGGAHKMKNAKEIQSNLNFKATQASKLSPHFHGGMGYYWHNNIRSEISYNLHSPSFEKHPHNFRISDSSDQSLTVGTIKVKRKAHIKSVMFNSYVDILENNGYKIFLGGGVGVARIKEKIHLLVNGSIISGSRMFTFPPEVTSSTTKKVNKFAYSFSAGTSITLQPNIHMDTIYSWHDFGKTKPVQVEDNEVPTKNRYRGHNVSIGIRLDI